VIDIVNFAKNSLRISDGVLIIVLLAVGTALLYARPRIGRRWLTVVALMFSFLSTPLGSSVLIAPLVRGFQPIEDPKQAQAAGAIVVLGGGIRDLKVGAERLASPAEGTTLRLFEAARIFRLLGSRLPVVATGGFTAAGRRTTEAAVMADVLVDLGVPREQIVIEGQSRNTYEQALNVTQLLQGRGINRFVLVTAPTHIRRSTVAFRAQNVDVVPSPAALLPDDAPRRRFFTPNMESLRTSDEALYDYAALGYYWWRGWLKAGQKDLER
jgi:uncharacterized SAM-binding protein YcdF (DUF218 family)